METDQGISGPLRLLPPGEIAHQLVNRGRQVFLGVEGGAVLAHLEVEVRAGGASGVPEVADGLFLPDRLAAHPGRLWKKGDAFAERLWYGGWRRNSTRRIAQSEECREAEPA